MCIGVPVQIVEMQDLMAVCKGRNGEEVVNMMLIGPQPEGTWILNFLGSGREVLSADEAEKINSALDGLTEIMNGNQDIDVDKYFPEIGASS